MNICSALNIPRKYFRFFFKTQEKWESYILNKIAEVYCPAAFLLLFCYVFVILFGLALTSHSVNLILFNRQNNIYETWKSRNSVLLLLGVNYLVNCNLVYRSKIHFLSDIRAGISDLITLSGLWLRVKYFSLRVSFIYIYIYTYIYKITQDFIKKFCMLSSLLFYRFRDAK